MADDVDVVVAAKSRQRRLFERLAARPVADVVGVVSPSGAGGGKWRGDERWTFKFAFEAWRVDSGDVRTQQLSIQREATDEELDRLRKQITPYTVIRIIARVISDSQLGGHHALLEEIVGTDTADAELNDFAAQLREPVIHVDAVFGKLTLDRSIDCFSGDVVWAGAPVRLCLLTERPVDVLEPLKTARALWERQGGWNQRIRDYALQELLPLKNNSWLDDDEAELTADQFKERMILESITVYPDGCFEFWHNDGDLFWGHSIVVSGNLVDGPTRADIPG